MFFFKSHINFFKIKFVSLWVHINARPNCVIVDNLYWTYIFQDTTTNHASGHIVVFRNFPKPGFIGLVKESWMYMLSPLLPSEWMLHCVYPVWPCSGFSLIFQDEIFHEYPMIFQDKYLIGLIRNPFPIPYLSRLVFIHPSLLQDYFQGGCILTKVLYVTS